MEDPPQLVLSGLVPWGLKKIDVENPIVSRGTWFSYAGLHYRNPSSRLFRAVNGLDWGSQLVGMISPNVLVQSCRLQTSCTICICKCPRKAKYTYAAVWPSVCIHMFDLENTDSMVPRSLIWRYSNMPPKAAFQRKSLEPSLWTPCFHQTYSVRSGFRNAYDKQSEENVKTMRLLVCRYCFLLTAIPTVFGMSTSPATLLGGLP